MSDNISFKKVIERLEAYNMEEKHGNNHFVSIPCRGYAGCNDAFEDIHK